MMMLRFPQLLSVIIVTAAVMEVHDVWLQAHLCMCNVRLNLLFKLLLLGNMSCCIKTEKLIFG